MYPCQRKQWPGYLPPPDVFGKSLYTLDIGQNDFTSKVAEIGIEGVKEYFPQLASQIVETVKVSAFLV